jgi:small subunit ribosomal protein S1
LEGLVHISELSWDKIGKPEEIVSVGDNVKVKVIGKKNGKLALSIKQTQKDPWEEAEKRYPKDKKVEGKVVRVSDFGMFVSLEPGVEGLVHITKIPPTKKFEVGDDVNVVIEEIDSKAKKLSLGLVLTAKPVGYK